MSKISPLSTLDRAGVGLVAVVVTFNRLEKLQKTLAALLNTSAEVLDRIVVVNNASTDGTGDWLATQPHDPRVEVIHSATNIGGAGGFDLGLRAAVARFDPDWLVVMDDDAYPEPGTLERFRAAPPKAEAIAAAVRYPDGRICDMNRPAWNPFARGLVFLRTALQGRGGFHMSPDGYEGPAVEVDVASFVGLFLSRAAIARVGYPDPELFIYTDDTLYTLSLTQAGGRLIFDPSLRFVHDMDSLAAGARRLTPVWKVYFYHRNLLTLYQRVSGWMFWLILPLILVKWRMRARDYGPERPVFLRLLRCAVRDALGRRGVASLAEVKALVEKARR